MYVRVHVYPGMKKEKVTVTRPNDYEIVIKAPAERNAANTRVREIIAETYKVPLAAVRIVSGHHSSRKILEVTTNESK
jgi:uncharacterized protein YggU (UPF0235/DUF167 family)